MFALPISMPRFQRINFYQNIPKIKLAPRLQQRLGVSPPGPQNMPHIANFWLRSWCFYCCYVISCKLILRLAVFMVFRLRLFVCTSLPTPDLEAAHIRYWHSSTFD